MITGLLRTIGEVVGIDADTVPADQTRGEIQKIPLGRGRGQNLAGVDAENMKYGGCLLYTSRCV